jgi:hypothetical protein
MAITSLVIKIGAQDEGIQKALDSLGKQANTVAAEIARLGTTPVGQQVIKSLDQIGASMKAVTEAHQKLADRAVNAARGMELMGGASKFTSDELAGLNRIAVKGVEAFLAMGQDAPPALAKMAAETTKVVNAGKGFNSFLGDANRLLGAFGVGLSIGAVVGFGKELLRMGDDIQRVADRTGLTTKEVQQLSYVASQSGNSIDEMTVAIGQLQNRVGSGDKSAVAAVKALGINLKALKDASPAEQLELIATKAAQIKDPMDLTRASMDLFGKSGSIILPTLVSDFARLRKEAPLMADATVKALDKAGDQIGRATLQIKIWVAELYNFVGRGLDTVISWAYKAVAAFSDVAVGVAKMIAKMPGGAKAMNALGVSIEEMTKNGQWFRDAASAMVNKTDDIAASAGKAGPKLKLLNQDTEAAGAKAKKAASEFATLTEKVHALEAGLFAVPDALKSIGRSFDESKLAQLADAVAKVEENSHIAQFGFKGMTEELRNVGIAALKTDNELHNFAAYDFTGPIQQKVVALGDSIKATFSKIPEMLMRAFEGGGGIGGALKAIGVSLSQALLQPLMQKLSALQKAGVSTGSAMAAALGGATGGGTGAAIAGIASGLGGAALAASAWGASMAAAGVAGTVALSAATLGIGAAAVGVYLLYKHFRSVEKQINPVREEFVKLNGGLAALNERAATAGVTLTAMLDARNPKAYEAAINDLNDAFAFQDEAMKLLDETAQKYGLTLAEMGPKYAQGKLDEQFLVLLQDQKVLAAGGVALDLILQKQATSFQELVNQAIKTGATIPAAMKPALERMLELGLLTDASGQKLTSLEGLTFAETLEAQFSTLITTIEKLAAAISGKLGTAISNIPAPAPVHIPIRFDIPDMPRFHDGGIVQRFAKGGRVLPFLSRGSDTVPAMLTPGERVLTVQETQAYEAGASRSGMSTAALERKLDQMMAAQATRDRNLPKAIRDAILLAPRAS